MAHGNQKCVRSPGAGVTGGCELPDMGLGLQLRPSGRAAPSNADPLPSPSRLCL